MGWFLAVLALGGCVAPGEVGPRDRRGAGTEQATPAADRQEPAVPLGPIVPADDKADWIQLKSGEWLRGEFRAMRYETVEFESDELDQLELDWNDITVVRLPRPRTLRLDQGEVVSGTVLVQGGGLMLNGDVTRRIERGRILAIVDSADGETPWSGNIGLNFSQRSGNAEQTDFGADAFVRTESAWARWDSSYTGTFSYVSGVETVNNHRLRSRLDWFLSRRLYLTPLGFDLFHDPFQNLAIRFTPYLAVGYHIVDETRVEWSVSSGPAYQFIRFDTIAAGGDEEQRSAAIVAQSRFNWDITSDIEFNFDFDVAVPVPETTAYNHHAEFRLSVDLIADFDFDFAFIWDRVNAPSEQADGTVPEADDFRTTVGVSYRF
jgi:putative salt-induced outer membrane protein YdiY